MSDATTRHMAVLAIVDALIAVADDLEGTYGPEDIADIYRARRGLHQQALPPALRA